VLSGVAAPWTHKFVQRSRPVPKIANGFNAAKSLKMFATLFVLAIVLVQIHVPGRSVINGVPQA